MESPEVPVGTRVVCRAVKACSRPGLRLVGPGSLGCGTGRLAVRWGFLDLRMGNLDCQRSDDVRHEDAAGTVCVGSVEPRVGEQLPSMFLEGTRVRSAQGGTDDEADPRRACRTLPCQAADASGTRRVCSSRHMRRMTRLAR